MNFWIDFWAVVLVVAVGCFVLLAVVVSIGGARDICKLLSTLREEREQITKNAEDRDST